MIDAIDVLCAQLTRDLFAIAKFLLKWWQAFGLIFKISPEFGLICKIRPNIWSKTEFNLNKSV